MVDFPDPDVPTSAILPALPLLTKDLVERDAIIVDSKSGISGAGRTPSEKTHFPNHAEVSAETYLKHFGNNREADNHIAHMIEHDMDVHLLKAVDIPGFLENPNAIGHLIAGLAELTSNANMFGGTDSVGFKMKYKHHVQRANAICKQLWG